MRKTRFLYQHGKSKALTISYDDGVQFDEKLVKILNRYKLKATFNVNSGIKPGTTWINKGIDVTRINLVENKDLYKEHEIAIHTLTHPHLEKLNENEILKEVLEDKINLERIYGGVIRGMSYPFGTYNSKVKDIIRTCWVDYSRTVVENEDFTLPNDFLEWHSTCRHANPRLMEITKRFLEKEDGELDLFYIWGHSYEFEVDNNWELIEEFAEKVSNKEDIWYATNIEVYDYITAVRSLKFSGNKSRVYNPSALDVWISVDGKTVKIDSRETIELL